MFWLILVLMVLVVGAAALAALGAGGSLPDAERDRLAARLPEDRPLVREDIDELRFPMAVRGYRMDEVDDTLDRMAAELSQREHRVVELESALAAALASPGAAGAVALEQRPTYRPTLALGKVDSEPTAPAAPQDAAPDAGTGEVSGEPGNEDKGEDEQR
ncbi:DivIVA domain-containing protein [Streptacidiphilus rugosus]|uniref:DivIVA domain-containing protein n=1 Tax=Streptacidiphilus rugosus TaxID=405783 RepID=UPI0007C6BF6F|nr:DivIVA domain-containing protein [Streptacidiphilus rugosus]